MDLKDILLDYYNDKKSLDDVIKNLSLFSIEYIENNIAQLDINRDLRKSIPEVVLAINKKESLPVNRGGKIGIICGGTSDIGIAEEARIASFSMGCSTYLGYDVGIAGIHRLLLSLKEMISNNVECLVVVAGMEGALSSVVTSLVNIPVIGVPASVGYGFGSNGQGSLSSMLQSCSFGLAVVNIDNGIGAGIFASLIANKGR